MNFVALDVETANPNLASICQIGIAEYENGQLTNEQEWLIDPEDYFNDMNIRIHGIHESDVRGKPTWRGIYPEIRKMLYGRVVVTHTAFDRNSILRVCDKYQSERIEYSWIDSARIVRSVWKEFSSTGYGLSNVARTLGISFQHHNAREDARAAGEIVIRAIQQSGIPWSEWLMGAHSPADNSSSKREGDSNGPLFGEVVVFTGALTMIRSDAADMASKAGCAVTPGVTIKTTLLVVGDQDITRLAGNTKSSKHRKAEALIANGQEIRILCESDFIGLMSANA